MVSLPVKRRADDLVKGVILTTMIVAMLGYFDYVTGEVSIDIFYMFCVLAVTWFANGYIGSLSITEIVFAKAAADHYDKVDIASRLYCWNSLNYLLVNIIACVLAVRLKKALSK